ncbi:hypothetical protein AA14337_0750 [Acetobacter malorum DSM 14337]|uniref:Uncharacterized protein n=1 Tax=Acetobacter malorum DSM 14337 TaxID=1307910 RepID=A0ABQ0PPU9_9PROT|nr:hypothetical protein [Acetobacter malorum]KXV08740.1 hypothetical protein AD930_03790 [Acetobacter malorum]GBQ77208.1 hypothetical protein AA14337_0750 [Acetobacter malorum DSM 14337]
MNNKRRAEIKRLRELLEEISGPIAEIKESMESLRDEEQESYDNMPESLQGGAKGEAAEKAVSDLDTAVDGMDEIESKLTEIQEALEEAAQ